MIIKTIDKEKIKKLFSEYENKMMKWVCCEIEANFGQKGLSRN